MGKNIDVLDYQPGYVATKMSKADVGTFCISAEDSAYHSLDDLGQTVTTAACWPHQLNSWFLDRVMRDSNFMKAGAFKGMMKAAKRIRERKMN